MAGVRRIYGDWTKPNLNGWKDCLLEHSIQPIQQFAYTTGKNATDGAMIIDAMDLLYTARFDGFCIVSSDSDFARLAARIREQGVTVYGGSGPSFRILAAVSRGIRSRRSVFGHADTPDDAFHHKLVFGLSTLIVTGPSANPSLRRI